MLKIRDFARLAEVSLATLRYYDEIGLVKPIHVDPDTGYRFYTVDQLPHLHRILAFKDLGLELTQISQIMADGITPEELQGMLRYRQTQLEQHIQAEQEQLLRIEARLRTLEGSATMPQYEVVLKAVKPIVGVSMFLTRTELDALAHWNDPIDATLQRVGVMPIDHLLVLHSGYENDGPVSVEVVAPVEERDIKLLVARSDGRLTRCELPAVAHMATTLHHGHPTRLLAAYHSLGSWIESNAYTIVGPRRKLRIRRSANLHDALTEIQFPVERVT